LRPDQDPKQTQQASCLEVGGPLKESEGSAEWKDIRLWDDVRVIPTSLESEFCILSSDGSKKQPILEALCSEILESIEGLAQEEVSIQQSQRGGRVRLFIFPAIVTNSKITVCQFKSSEVRITDGTLDFATVKLDSVPFIRFRKSMATEFPAGKVKNLKDAHRARERTVFVVNAVGLSAFLNGWKVEAKNSIGFAFERYLNMHDRF
jgi:hypothetical protein